MLAAAFFREACTIPRNEQEIAQTIHSIAWRLKKLESEPLTTEHIRTLFAEIDRVVYHGKLFPLISRTFRKPDILFTIRDAPCENVEAFLEIVKYERGDPEFAHHTLGIQTALPCLNALHDVVYYSGGYTTRSKLQFLLLMLLHESIHLVEFADPHLRKCTENHTVFFYSVAYTYFRLVSRLSSDISPSTIRTDISSRRAKLEDIVRELSSGHVPYRRLCEDAVEVLGDHSERNDDHDEFGYFAYTLSMDGGKHPHVKPLRRLRNSRRRQ